MEFQILGSPTFRGPAGAVEPAGRLQRVLLGVLLARANEPVGVDVLTDAMWDGRPDGRAPQRLQFHVHKLRRLLDDPARLSHGPSGYRLAVGPDELDATRFAELVGRGVAADSPQRRAELVRRALDLWRGRPFDGLDVPLLDDEARRLGDRRMAAVEVLYEAEVAVGRNPDVVAELAGLVREHPLREKLAALLMTALYRDGRQAEALEVYRVTRATLVAELGLEPGPELRAVEGRILDGAPVGPEPSPVPAQLPSNVTGFVGRAAELSQLDDVLADVAPVVVVTGTAGVGKTALVVRWSHQLRDRFPDGQLYVDLRGYGPADPLLPEDALAGFLRALGVEGQSIPADLAERSARFRTLVDGRRMVLVLDNARTAEQVRPLLPGSGTVAVLVTSRDSLAGLVAREGAHRIRLDRLPRDESVDLLTRLAGDPDGSVDPLVDLCARLPLALRVAGELLRSRRGHSVEQLVAELVDEQRRLDLLDSDGDSHTAVRAVFSWSYQNLADADALLFRLCGVHPGHDVDAYAMAAMTGGRLLAARCSPLAGRAGPGAPAGGGGARPSPAARPAACLRGRAGRRDRRPGRVRGGPRPAAGLPPAHRRAGRRTRRTAGRHPRGGRPSAEPRAPVRGTPGRARLAGRGTGQPAGRRGPPGAAVRRPVVDRAVALPLHPRRLRRLGRVALPGRALGAGDRGPAGRGRRAAGARQRPPPDGTRVGRDPGGRAGAAPVPRAGRAVQGGGRAEQHRGRALRGQPVHRGDPPVRAGGGAAADLR